MSHDLGGPREGLCRTRSFVIASQDPFRIRDDKDLGLMPWADLLDLVEAQGGTRPTFDLFDVPQADGTVLRYRAVNDGYLP
ncbi:hypothetical protein ACWKSP_22150 [Micromonosporaceae bacterium Da 78-11]